MRRQRATPPTRSRMRSTRLPRSTGRRSPRSRAIASATALRWRWSAMLGESVDTTMGKSTGAALRCNWVRSRRSTESDRRVRNSVNFPHRGDYLIRRQHFAKDHRRGVDVVTRQAIDHTARRLNCERAGIRRGEIIVRSVKKHGHGERNPRPAIHRQVRFCQLPNGKGNANHRCVGRRVRLAASVRPRAHTSAAIHGR
jgi:hypothetical protein